MAPPAAAAVADGARVRGEWVGRGGGGCEKHATPRHGEPCGGRAGDAARAVMRRLIGGRSTRDIHIWCGQALPGASGRAAPRQLPPVLCRS